MGTCIEGLGQWELDWGGQREKMGDTWKTRNKKKKLAGPNVNSTQVENLCLTDKFKVESLDTW